MVMNLRGEESRQGFWQSRLISSSALCVLNVAVGLFAL
jgi:hypothetical protein